MLFYHKQKNLLIIICSAATHISKSVDYASEV
jgi:hypothetical protein